MLTDEQMELIRKTTETLKHLEPGTSEPTPTEVRGKCGALGKSLGTMSILSSITMPEQF